MCTPPLSLGWMQQQQQPHKNKISLKEKRVSPHIHTHTQRRVRVISIDRCWPGPGVFFFFFLSSMHRFDTILFFFLEPSQSLGVRHVRWREKKTCTNAAADCLPSHPSFYPPSSSFVDYSEEEKEDERTHTGSREKVEKETNRSRDFCPSLARLVSPSQTCL